MKKIYLLSCSKKKQTSPCIAAKMYEPSTLFSLSYQYAKENADCIYILSAKYGLLEEDTKIEPYNVTLNDFSSVEKKSGQLKLLRS